MCSEDLGVGEGTTAGDSRDDLAGQVSGGVGVDGAGDVALEVGALPPLLVVEGEACVQDHEAGVSHMLAKPFDADDGALVHAVILPVNFVPILKG